MTTKKQLPSDNQEWSLRSMNMSEDYSPKRGEPEIRYIGGTDPYMADGNLHNATIMRFKEYLMEDVEKEKTLIERVPSPSLLKQMYGYYEKLNSITLTDLLKRFGDRLSEEEKEKLKSICNNQQE